MRGLLDGPFREADVLSVLHDIELEIGAAVDADPYAGAVRVVAWPK